MSRNPWGERDVLLKNYLDSAEEAADVERSGNYAKAYILWNNARKLALTQTQAAWCKIRSDYCFRWQGKRELIE